MFKKIENQVLIQINIIKKKIVKNNLKNKKLIDLKKKFKYKILIKILKVKEKKFIFGLI